MGSEGRPTLVPIFGITQRCGTNYLYDLLRRHPDCSGLARVHEDFVFAEASLLERYVRSVRGRWDAGWGGLEEAEGVLRRELAEGVARALVGWAEDGRRTHVVSKTPSAGGLEWARGVERCAPVVLVRDGRSVIASGMRSFGWRFEEGLERWVEGARWIVAAREVDPAPLVVRYEELYGDPETSLRGIFAYAGLDPEVYDYEGAREQPVRGSSELGSGGVHWEPVERGAGFDPLNRFADWGEEWRSRFAWRAGEWAVQLGYEVEEASGLGWNAVQDAKWWAWKRARGVRDRWRGLRG